MINKLDYANSNKIYRAAFIILIFLPVLFINLRTTHNWGGDFAQYINQAKCICEGKNQAETGYIFNDQNPYLGPPSYPIGFPLILAPAYFFFGNNILVFSCLISIFLFSLSIIITELNKLYFNFASSVLISVAFIYNPLILRFKASVLSDIPFAVFFILSIYYYLKKSNSQKIQIKNSILLGLLICFSMLIKSIGIVIIPAIFLDIFVHSIKNKNLKISRFYNPFVTLVSVLSFYVLFNYVIFHSKSEHYSFFSTLFSIDNIGSVLKFSFKYYLDLIRTFFSGNSVVSVLTVILFLIGFIKKLTSKSDIIDYIFIAYLFILLVFPAVQGFRYLLPIYPIFLIYVGYGILSLKENFKIKRAYLFQLALIVILLLNYPAGIQSVIKSQKKTLAGPQTAYSIEAFDYIQKNTDKTSIFTFVKPRVLALYTDRQSIGIGRWKSAEEIERKFSEVGVDYILTVEDKRNQDIENYIAYYNQKVKLVWSNNKFKIFKRIN